MNHSINGHRSQPRQILTHVWYEGTNDIVKGQGLCYDADYGTATASDGTRRNRVEFPDNTNNLHFAGVAARNYKARAGGMFIEIYEPGSVCEIAIGVDTTIDTGIVTCSAGDGDAGRFTLAGFPGRGSAVPLQTNASGRITGEWDGTGSLATDGKTLTGTGFGDVEAGDYVVFVGSEDEGSSKTITLGKYKVASVTSATVLVLTESVVGATPTAALKCSYYVISGNPTCLAFLQDGPESGLQEVVTPPNTGAADAMSFMVGGVTYINGGITIGTADANGALADGAFFGLRKGFYCKGTMTTNDVTVTLATAGKQEATEDTAGTSGAILALASAAFDAVDEFLFLEWVGLWKEISHSGATLAAS